MLYYKRKTFLKQILEKPHRGNIRDVMIVALPMLLSMSFDTLMTFADRLFLAKLSPELMNAALAGGSAQVMVMTFFNGLIAYSTAQVAQNFGAKQFHNCSKSCTQAAILALVCTPLVLLVKPFVYWLFSLSEVSSVQLEAQTVYFNTLLYGAVLILFRQVFVSFFSGIGKTKIVMVAAFIGLVVNVTMNYLLIFGVSINGTQIIPSLGITGAALATLFARIVECILLLTIGYKKKLPPAGNPKELFGFGQNLFSKYLRIGIPVIINETLWSFGITLQNRVYARAGTDVIAAFNISNTVAQISWVFLMGIGNAAAVLIGKKIGEGNKSLAYKYSHRVTILAPIVASIVALLLIPLSKILHIFFDGLTSGKYPPRSIIVFCIILGFYHKID